MPETPFDALRFVFVVTYGRSGSTLLMNVLNAIPGYCVRGENLGALNHMQRAATALGEARTRFGADAARLGGAAPFHGADGLDGPRVAERLALLFTEEVLRPPPGTRVAGFKEIRHTPGAMTDAQFHAYMDFLLTAFPRARIVFQSRDPAAVARSGWWRTRDPEEVRALLGQTERRFRRRMEASPDRCLMLHFDDWAGIPAGLIPLFDFLGEPFDEARLRDVMARPVSKPRRRTLQRSVDLRQGAR